MANILQKFRDWLSGGPPAPPPEEVDPPEPTSVPWIKVGLLARKLSMPHLRAVFFTVPVIVFFTLSGVLAWLVLLVKFVVTLYNLF